MIKKQLNLKEGEYYVVTFVDNKEGLLFKAKKENINNFGKDSNKLDYINLLDNRICINTRACTNDRLEYFFRIATEKEKEWLDKCLTCDGSGELDDNWIPKVGDWIVITKYQGGESEGSIVKVTGVGKSIYYDSLSGNSNYTTDNGYFREATQQEIEGYIKSKKNNMFKKDDYVVLIKEDRNTLFSNKIVNYCFKLLNCKENNCYKVDLINLQEAKDFRNPDGGYIINKDFFRGASKEEIEYYNKIGEPYHISTLKKELTFLPEKWCVKPTTLEQSRIIGKWFDKNHSNFCDRFYETIKYPHNFYFTNAFERSDVLYFTSQRTEITFKQFEKWVLNKTKDKQEYFPDLSKHVGRYLKALVDNPDGGLGIRAGDYGIIKNYYEAIFPTFSTSVAYYCPNALSENNLGIKYELMPEGFKSPNIETKPDLEVNRWYKMTSLIGPDYLYIKPNFISKDLIKVSNYINDEGNFSDVVIEIKYIDYYTFTLLTDLSEIQEYLPVGHIDKIEKVIYPVTYLGINYNYEIAHSINQTELYRPELIDSSGSITNIQLGYEQVIHLLPKSKSSLIDTKVYNIKSADIEVYQPNKVTLF